MMFLDPGQNEEAVAECIRHHTAVAADHGHPGTNQHALMVYAQVADTDAEAAAIIRGPLRESLRARAGEWERLRDSWRQQSDTPKA